MMSVYGGPQVKRETSLQRLATLIESVGISGKDLADIVDTLQSIPSRERRELYSLCTRGLHTKSLRERDDLRLVAVKVLVALLPDSESTIRSLLREHTSPLVHEVHFSLFCFLDHVPDLPGCAGFAPEIPSLVGRYLEVVRTESGMAAWMAGDLLGDHWDLDESLPVLVRAVRQARFVAGRLGALKGLSSAYDNAKRRGRGEIKRVLREVAKEDRSRKVRDRAQCVLMGWGGTVEQPGRAGRGTRPADTTV
jgi:hypothetical protein